MHSRICRHILLSLATFSCWEQAFGALIGYLCGYRFSEYADSMKSAPDILMGFYRTLPIPNGLDVLTAAIGASLGGALAEM